MLRRHVHRILGELLVVSTLLTTQSFAIVNLTNDVQFFYSRPDLRPPILKIEHKSPAFNASGYIFVGPWWTMNLENGPHIFDTSGMLIWSGTAEMGGGNCHSPHVCTYNHSPHLCYFQGQQMTSMARGRGVIIDGSYRSVANVYAANGRMPLDMHEFHLTQGDKTALANINTVQQADLTSLGAQNMGWIFNNMFQEIDIESGKTVFEWSSIEHINISESATQQYLQSPQPLENPWDYLHLNSIQKLADGDYIMSGRHTHAIYKISHRDGSIVWRCGGAFSDFELVDFKLGFQHHVRVREETQTHMVLTLFNNGANGNMTVNNASYGAYVKLDLLSRKAFLLKSFEANREISSVSQGSMEVLDNNDVFINWGLPPVLTQHSEDGELLFQAVLANDVTSNYRASRGDWIGRPRDLPALWVFSKTIGGRTACYVSWNGATEVFSWNFYGARDNSSVPSSFQKIGSADKAGFETRFLVDGYYPYVFAEAVAQDHTSLANSTVATAFIPGPSLAASCDDYACPFKMERDRDRSHSNSHHARYTWIASYQKLSAFLLPLLLLLMFRKEIPRFLSNLFRVHRAGVYRAVPTVSDDESMFESLIKAN